MSVLETVICHMLIKAAVLANMYGVYVSMKTKNRVLLFTSALLVGLGLVIDELLYAC